MKIVLLAAFIAAVTCGDDNQLSSEGQAHDPWQVGKLYRYDVDSYTLARLKEGPNSGSAFKAHFTIRVPSSGRILAKLEDPRHAIVQQELPNHRKLPEDLKYEPVQKLDQPFEIVVEGGRVTALHMPNSISLAHENLLKGLISALQIDLSTHRLVRSSDNGYNKQHRQGSFKKMETDVTGDCETLYSVYPPVSEWRMEIPKFAKDEEPMMISKVKNYGHCHHRVAYNFGVPEGSEWSGVIHKKHQDQLVRRTTTSRMLVGKQGPIYKTETSTTVQVSPQLYGKDKAEVFSVVRLELVAHQQDNEAEWPMEEEKRNVKNLLYSVSAKQVEINDRSWESESKESLEQFSKTIDWSSQNKPNRIRRYAKNPKTITINKVLRNKRHSGEADRSSSSSMESTSALVNDHYSDETQTHYTSMYMTPDKRTDKKQSPVNVQKLIQDMAQQLQNPSNMPKSDFLSKFNIVVRLLSLMSSEQLELTSRSLETTKSSNNMVKANMWMIYRDAVAQVGNMPSFQQIKKWIETKKIEEEEAAQVAASLVSSIRYPTKQIRSEFFKLAVTDTVRQQKHLNSTALIAATRLFNMAMKTPLAGEHDAFVAEEVLPRLSQDLKQAVDQQDSTKAQTVIKAIGNLGHRDILKIFAPYLQGEIRTSSYLRTQMVQNLGVLAHEKDSHVRVVLFRILKNIAEPYEVRVAAIQKIFKARPTSAMMMAMAQMTHDDPSVQIRALLKSSILSAAELKSPHTYDLARTAQAVKWMITKQHYGKQYSSMYLNEYEDMEQENSFMSVISYIGSEESFIPQSVKLALKSKSQRLENSIAASVSDLQELYKLWEQNMGEIPRQKPATESNHKYSAEKIYEMLGIKRDRKHKDLEASLTVNWMGQERFFTLTESDLKQLPILCHEFKSRVATGVEHHYTKVLNQAQVSILFPLASGMPFMFRYKEPMVIHFNNKITSKDLQFDEETVLTYARNLDGKVGFLDTLANQYAQVGVINKIQLQLPLKLQIIKKTGHLEISLGSLRPEQDDTLLHYSVWPYSTIQKEDTLVTVSHDPNTRIINRSHKTVSFDTKFGQSVGQVYQIQGYSYSLDYSKGVPFFSKDFLTYLMDRLYQRDIATTHFNLRHLGKQSQNKRVVFTVAYDTYYNPKQETENDQSLVASNIEDVNANSEGRRSEMAKRVSSGINNAKISIVDLSVSFEGQKKQQFVATAAMAENPTSPKIQWAIFLNRNSDQHGSEQINSVATVFRLPVTPLNFVEALTKDLKMNFNADISFGKSGNGNIHLQGYAERTQKRTEQLQKEALAQQCVEQTEKNNVYQQACYKMLSRAYAPDYIKASIKYKDVSPVFRNMTYMVSRYIDHIGYQYSEVNPLKVTPEGKIEIELNMAYHENAMDLAVSSKLGELHKNRVPMPKFTTRALSLYTPFTPVQRVMNFYTRDQYQPFCTIDSSKIRTFSNRSYDYTLTNTWHVVMHDEDSTDKDDLAVLAKRTQDKQLKLYISYKSYSGHDLELEVEPQGQDNKATVNVKTNAKKILDGENIIYMNEVNHEPLLEYYWQENVLVIRIKDHRLHAMYNGQSLVIINNENRNGIIGLCGHLSGDARDDYFIDYKVVEKPEYYGAFFALRKSDSDPKTMQLKDQAKQFSYPLKREFTIIYPSDEEWKKTSKDSEENVSNYRNLYKSKSFLKKEKECKVDEQVQYFESHGEICITVSPLPACQSHCSGQDYSARAVQVVCGPKLDQQFLQYKEQIRQGENPKPEGPPKQQAVQYRVPASCQA